MKSLDRLQPSLFCAQGQYFIKADNTVIPLPSASCFTEAIETTFMSFWVFESKYPDSLNVFYQFLEFIVGINKKNVGAAIRELLRELEKA